MLTHTKVHNSEYLVSVTLSDAVSYTSDHKRSGYAVHLLQVAFRCARRTVLRGSVFCKHQPVHRLDISKALPLYLPI